MKAFCFQAYSVLCRSGGGVYGAISRGNLGILLTLYSGSYTSLRIESNLSTCKANTLMHSYAPISDSTVSYLGATLCCGHGLLLVVLRGHMGCPWSKLGLLHAEQTFNSLYCYNSSLYNVILMEVRSLSVMELTHTS